VTGVRLDALLDRLHRLSVSSVCDADKSLPVCDPAIRPLLPELTLVGPAFTVLADGDLLGMLLALGQAPAGSVLVVDTRGCPLAASGELFANEAVHRDLAGIVIDGNCRDRRGIRRAGLPVYARGSYPMAGTMTGPARLGEPGTCGGVAVRTGDVVFGDEDGLVIAPAARLAAAVERAEEIEGSEAALVGAMERGVGLHDLTNAAEHLRARAAGQDSTFTFRPPR